MGGFFWLQKWGGSVFVGDVEVLDAQGISDEDFFCSVCFEIVIFCALYFFVRFLFLLVDVIVKCFESFEHE